MLCGQNSYIFVYVLHTITEHFFYKKRRHISEARDHIKYHESTQPEAEGVDIRSQILRMKYAKRF